MFTLPIYVRGVARHGYSNSNSNNNNNTVLPTKINKQQHTTSSHLIGHGCVSVCMYVFKLEQNMNIYIDRCVYARYAGGMANKTINCVEIRNDNTATII